MAPLALDDFGAHVLRSWLEHDVAGGGADVRFCQLYDTSAKGLRTVTRPLALQLADAGVAAMMRVFSLAKVEEQVAVLGAVTNNIMPVPDMAQREGSLENVCLTVLASLKACAERGWAIPTNPDWRARMCEILMASLVARPPSLQRLAAEAIAVLMRLTSDQHLQEIIVALSDPPHAPAAPKRGAPTESPPVDARIYVCMCACMWVHVCACMYSHTHTHTRTHAFMCVCVHVCGFMSVHACTHTHTHTHTGRRARLLRTGHRLCIPICWGHAHQPLYRHQ
jgi:hypothetical protein